MANRSNNWHLIIYKDKYTIIINDILNKRSEGERAAAETGAAAHRRTLVASSRIRETMWRRLRVAPLRSALARSRSTALAGPGSTLATISSSSPFLSSSCLFSSDSGSHASDRLLNFMIRCIFIWDFLLSQEFLDFLFSLFFLFR